MLKNDKDVYLKPLVKELKVLWVKGMDIYDVSIYEMFRMWVALMWTISDFPRLGTLLGWNTHIRLACLTCNFNIALLCMPHNKKWCF